MDQSPFVKRQTSLREGLAQAGLSALALNPGPTLTYLTGLSFHLMERPIVALFTPNALNLVLPELETRKLEGLPYTVQAFPYGEDPRGWGQVFQKAIQSASFGDRPVGVEPNRLRFLELRMLEAAAPLSRFVSGEAALTQLRICKDSSEIAAMRQAVVIAQNALLATLPAVKIGLSEHELAAELTLQTLRAGSQSELPFAPIVSTGPNGANPHAVPSERRLAAGDLLVIDWGASYQGYVADLTRTFALGKVEMEFERIHAIVQEANAAGRAAGGPGMPAGDVDRAARAVIEKAGYGPYFTHRTGHGIGMEGHEPPYMYAENELLLAPGMAYTVEPGIYLPGRGGVRIEDDLIVTSQGAESLSDLPRTLQAIG